MNKKKIKDIGELQIISFIKEYFHFSFDEEIYDKNLSVVTGIGDDSAVIELSHPTNQHLLITTDMLVEDKHFSFKFINPYLLGRKSIIVNISDIAAMGGTPKFLLLSIGLNPNFLFDDLKELLRGMRDICNEYKIQLIGGDTVGSKKLVLSISLIGNRNNNLVLPLRSNAKVGDNIYVTGSLGDSGLGLKILNENIILFGEDRNYLVQRHLSPSPRLKESLLLSENIKRFALIDISDGLFSELNHIAQESDVKIKIYLDKIPLSNQLKNTCGKLKFDSLEFALFGGEDYELLFTCDENESIIKQLFKRHSLADVKLIGKVVDKGYQIIFLDETEKEVHFKDKRFNHFSNI